MTWTPYPKRSGLNLIGALTYKANPDRVDVRPPEVSSVYLFSAAGVSGGDTWLAPGGLTSPNQILTPVTRARELSEIWFHILGTALAVDSVQIDICRAEQFTSAANPTGLTLTVPANTAKGTYLSATLFNVLFNPGDRLGLRLRQSGSAVQASWKAYISVA